MKKLYILLWLFAFTMTLVVPAAEAQQFTRKKRYGSVGVTFGAINYFGDIVPEPDFTSFHLPATRPNIGISYTYRYFPRISFRAAFHWGRLTGDDMESASVNEAENAGRFRRNLSFRNDIKEISAVAIIDLFENRETFERRSRIIPYGFVGVAVFHHNPKAYHERGGYFAEGIGILPPELDIPTGWYELQPLGTEGQFVEGGNYPEPYKRVQFAIPAGLGVRYKIANNWDVALELGWRKTFTDYLDDASEGYASKADLLSERNRSSDRRASAIFSDRSAGSGFLTAPDPSGTPYAVVPGYGSPVNDRRGNTSDDDWYITSNLSISYIISPQVRSPKFR